MQNIFSSFLFLTLVSCHFFSENFDNKDYEILKVKSDTLGLTFSHNINGETHPCGCRHFPLGGLPQVAGVHKTIKDKGDLLYVDSGDTFFASSIIPESLAKGLLFKAENLALGLEQLGLRYFLPGDQDFAAGWEFLQKLAKERKFHFLISNLKDTKKIKHKSWVLIENGPHKIFLLGFLSPDVLSPKYSQDFLTIEPVLKAKIKFLKTKGWNPKSPSHRLIVLSHAGIDHDEKLASQFPEIDWIIGAHTQSFFRHPRKIGTTQIVQVLSRNHYVGEISLSLKENKKKDLYTLHETRDEMKDKLKPNPFIAFIDDHKKRASEIQKKEQAAMAITGDPEGKMPTASSCIECHESQGDHWLKTPHALAYATLINAQEENNLACVQCHSVGLGKPQGFKTVREMITFTDEISEKGKKQEEKQYQKYLAEVKKLAAPIKSVRKLKPKKIKKLAQKWIEIEKSHHVLNNFANVQCLNCHTKHIDHPFEPEDAEILTKTQEMDQMKKNCLQCHNTDQSPAWYTKNSKGLADKPNWTLINQKIKEFSCPQK